MIIDANMIANFAAAGTLAYIVGKAIYDFFTGLMGKPPPMIVAEKITAVLP